MHILLFIIGLLVSPCLHAQDILFASTPEDAMSHYAEQEPQLYGHCTDSLRIDSVYTEDATTGELVLGVQTYPFARYEFYLDGALYRRIDILQNIDTQEVGWRRDFGSRDTIGVVTTRMMDIPNGAYHEFFPNGNIRFKGTLDGFNADGTPRKTGQWTEWDEKGNVVRRETYP